MSEWCCWSAPGWCPRRTLSWSGAARGPSYLGACRPDLTGGNARKEAVDLVQRGEWGRGGVRSRSAPSFTPQLPLTFHSGFVRGEDAGVSTRGRADVQVKLDVLLQLEALSVIAPRED